MLGRFFDTSAIDQFAAAVADDVRRSLPPADCNTDSKAARKARAAAEARVRTRVQAFAGSTRLNVYQKAKLGLRLQDALSLAGYPDDFAKRLSYDVVSQVAAAMR
jgi:hypothetical protein